MSDKNWKEIFHEYFCSVGIVCSFENDELWYQENGVIKRFSPALQSKYVKIDAKAILKNLNGKILLNSFCDENINSSKWYAVICDHAKGIDEYSSQNTRSKLRRASKRLRVEIVQPKKHIDKLFEVFQAANLSYNSSMNHNSKVRFFKLMGEAEKYEKNIHLWVVWEKDKIIGYSHNYLLGNVEANYSSIKFHPEYMKNYSSYLLIHEMNNYYLKNNIVNYVNDGFRTLLHDTLIQSFLIEKFGFKKYNLRLEITYNRKIALAVSVLYRLKSIVSKLHPKINAIISLEEIRREEKIEYQQ